MLVKCKVLFGSESDGLAGFPAAFVLIYVNRVGSGYDYIEYSIACHIANVHTLFIFERSLMCFRAWCIKSANPPPLIIVESAFVSDQDFFNPEVQAGMTLEKLKNIWRDDTGECNVPIIEEHLKVYYGGGECGDVVSHGFDCSSVPQ